MKNKKTSSEGTKNLHDQENDNLNKLFEEASKAESKHGITVSDQETEEAFQSVAQKSGIQDSSGSIFNIPWPRYAAAAVFLLLALGIAYLFTPVEVSVPNGTTRTIELPDQTTVILNSNSTLAYPRWFGWQERTVTLSGEAFFKVAKTGEPFKVITQNAQITVLGTEFNVRARANNTQNKTTIFLKEGRVSFAPRYQPEEAIILEPGQLSWISGQQPNPVPPQEVDQSKAIAWLQQDLSFENQPLSAIFKELSRRFDVKIKSKSNQILQEKLTIYIANPKSAEQTLQDICRAKGLHYTRKGDIFIIKRPS